MVRFLTEFGYKKILFVHLFFMLVTVSIFISLDFNLQNNLLFISFLAFSGTSFLSFLLLLSLEPRIRTLREAALKVATGSFNFEVEDEMDDSLGEVSTAFSKMTSELNKLNSELDLKMVEVDCVDFRRKITLAAARIVEWEYDPKTHNFALNKFWRSELGLKVVGYEDAGFLSQLVPDDRKQLLLQLSEFQDGGEELIEFPVRLLSLEGEIKPAWILVRGQLIDYEREIIGGVLLDISEQKELEDQLAQVNKLESIGQLASGIAHEINTPMQYIGDNLKYLKKTNEKLFNYSDILEKALFGQLEEAGSNLSEFVTSEKSKLKIDKLKQNSNEAADDAIEGVLSVSKIVGAMKDFAHPDKEEKALCDINQIVKTAIAVSRNEWKLVARLEERLFEGLQKIPGYKGELNQVILNIIVNAAQAISEKKLKLGESDREQSVILVETFENQENQTVEIKISDNGPGMPEEVKEKVFDQFFTTKDVGKGTGQGLSICYSIITNRHDGDIRVFSKLGEGTAFLISLPIAGGG